MEIKPTSVKIPPKLKAKIKKAAKENGQTSHGRIVHLLELAHK